MPPGVALLALLALNAWTMHSFYADKIRARAGMRRIPESRLLSLALFGGWPGALLARRLYRHKTVKQPFAGLLYLAAMANVTALALLI